MCDEDDHDDDVARMMMKLDVDHDDDDVARVMIAWSLRLQLARKRANQMRHIILLL